MFFRKVVLGLTLFSQLMATFGFPMPSVAARAKDTSQAFPCMYHHCGCQSAEDCWNNCCCNTANERLAWADERGVAVPDSLREAAQQEKASCPDCDSRSSCPDCESTDSCPNCNSEDDECDGSPDCQHCKNQQPTGKDSTGSRVDWVAGFMAQRCRGDAQAGLTQGPPAVPPEAAQSWHFDWRLVETLPQISEQTLVVSHQPATPPPID